MKKFDFKDFISGFKDVFSSTQNLKIVLLAVLVLFVIFFWAMGGCTSCGCAGLVKCEGKSAGQTEADAPAKESAPAGSSCAGSNAGGEKEERLFKDSEVGTATVDVDDATTLVLYYPTDVISCSDCPEDAWPYFSGREVLWADGRYAIDVETEYFSDMYNSATKTNPTTGEEVFAAVKANADLNNDSYMDITLGGKKMLWREYAGSILLYYLPENCEKFVKFEISPANADPNADNSISRAVALMYDDEIRAIFGAMELATAERQPTAAEDVVFRTYPKAELITTGKAAEWPTLGGTVHKVDQTMEDGNYKLRLDSVEIYQDAEGQDIVAFNIEFVNGGDKPICCNDAFYVQGFQSAGMDITGSRAGGYITAQPGQSVIFQKFYVLDYPDSSISLEVTRMEYDEETDSYNFGDELGYIDAVPEQ